MCGPLLVAAVLLLSHGIAQAQPAPSGGPPAKTGSAEGQAAAAEPDSEGEASDDSARLPSAGPAGLDWRTGHFIVTGKVGAAMPAGSITGDVATRELVGDGIGFGGSIGVGISRYAVLSLGGSYALLPGVCDTCSGKTFTLGADFAYHIAQGIAFDPWVSFGAGYRSAAFVADTALSNGLRVALDGSRYHGIDIARIALGGDFYPIPGFGFGGYFEAGAGTFLARPQPDRGASAYAFFEIGARIAFDPLRWNWGPAQTQVGSLR
jgi:hypothetical protein